MLTRKLLHTRTIQRPGEMPANKYILFGQGPANEPTPISARFAQDERTGHLFID